MSEGKEANWRIQSKQFDSYKALSIRKLGVDFTDSIAKEFMLA